MEDYYSLQVVGVILRLLGWYVLLFGVLGPYILPNIPRTALVYRLMHSWIGLGGLILLSTIILVQVYLYDFISVALLLICLPFFIYVKTYKAQGYSYGKALSLIYDRLLLRQIRFIERFSWKNVKNRTKDKFGLIGSINHMPKNSHIDFFLVPSIALAGAFIRFFPAFTNAAPFTRSWYNSLHRVKEISLQNYFDVSVDPGGMHVLVNFFSKLTQVSPELIVHLLGGLTSMLISVWIYGIILGMVNDSKTLAPLIGMALYALAPVIIMPISLESQVVPNTLDLALSFALPAIMVWVRNLRKGDRMVSMFVVGGVIATGLTNLFVLLLILLPGLIFLGLTVQANVSYSQRLLDFGKLVVLIVVLLSVYWLVVMLNLDMNFQTYLLEQLYSSQFYTYFPYLLLPLERMALIYGVIAVFVGLLSFLGNYLTQKKETFQYQFYLIFILVSALFFPELAMGYTSIDLDQLSVFYAILIAVLGGLLFSNVVNLVICIFKRMEHWRPYVEGVFAVAGIGFIFILQGGIKTSNVLPQTLPNGFFYGYYQIIEENLPYTYATVGPSIDSTLAKNRHYFMNYRYFLNNYNSIDSLYHEQLATNVKKQNMSSVPPASIFIFVAKPPYQSIQSGILNNPSSIMEALRQWIREYEKMENRKVRIFNNYENATIYELVNREGEVRIEDILDHTYPDTLDRMN